jgi:hypothetical protein
VFVKRFRWAGRVAAAGLLLAACSDPVDVGSFSVSGSWQGTVYVPAGTDSVPFIFRLELEQSGETVSGSGVVRAPADSVETSVQGEWSYPRVRLLMSSSGYEDIDFNSAFTPQSSRDTLSGPLTGSGFTGRTLKLVRQGS